MGPWLEARRQAHAEMAQEGQPQVGSVSSAAAAGQPGAKPGVAKAGSADAAKSTESSSGGGAAKPAEGGQAEE